MNGKRRYLQIFLFLFCDVFLLTACPWNREKPEVQKQSTRVDAVRWEWSQVDDIIHQVECSLPAPYDFSSLSGEFLLVTTSENAVTHIVPCERSCDVEAPPLGVGFQRVDGRLRASPQYRWKYQGDSRTCFYEVVLQNLADAQDTLELQIEFRTFILSETCDAESFSQRWAGLTAACSDTVTLQAKRQQ